MVRFRTSPVPGARAFKALVRTAVDLNTVLTNKRKQVCMVKDKWAAGDAYEAFMGRWSRQMAERFVRWLAPGPQLHCLKT